MNGTRVAADCESGVLTTTLFSIHVRPASVQLGRSWDGGTSGKSSSVQPALALTVSRDTLSLRNRPIAICVTSIWPRSWLFMRVSTSRRRRRRLRHYIIWCSQLLKQPRAATRHVLIRWSLFAPLVYCVNLFSKMTDIGRWLLQQPLIVERNCPLASIGLRDGNFRRREIRSTFSPGIYSCLSQDFYFKKKNIKFSRMRTCDKSDEKYVGNCFKNI